MTLNAKEKMIEVIKSQPDDATYEEIMRELVFKKREERADSNRALRQALGSKEKLSEFFAKSPLRELSYFRKDIK